jgi:hypothetical protein
MGIAEIAPDSSSVTVLRCASLPPSITSTPPSSICQDSGGKIGWDPYGATVLVMHLSCATSMHTKMQSRLGTDATRPVVRPACTPDTPNRPSDGLLACKGRKVGPTTILGNLIPAKSQIDRRNRVSRSGGTTRTSEQREETRLGCRVRCTMVMDPRSAE